MILKIDNKGGAPYQVIRRSSFITLSIQETFYFSCGKNRTASAATVLSVPRLEIST